MAKARYINKGETVQYTATKAVSYHDVVAFKHCIGVAVQSIDAKDIGTVAIAGAFELPKAKGAIKAGEKVYYSAATDNITTTNSDVPAGIALQEATSEATTVVVKLG